MALRVALAVFALALFACVAGYLALSVPRAWFGGAPQVRWTARELSLARGTGGLKGDSLALTAPDATRTVVVSLVTTLRAQDYSGDRLERSRHTRRRRGGPALVQRLPARARVLAPVDRRGRPHRAGASRPASATGSATSAAWPWCCAAISPSRSSCTASAARPMTAMQVLADRGSEWLAFEPWNGTSINTLTGGADAQDLPLPLLLAAVVALPRWPTPGSRAGSPQRFARARRPPSSPHFFVGAWFLLDARWQWNLAASGRAHAARSTPANHGASATSPPKTDRCSRSSRRCAPSCRAPPVRVFMVADVHYFRDRGAYHLYPYNVYFDPWSDTIAPSSALHPGRLPRRLPAPRRAVQRRGSKACAGTTSPR